MINLHNSDRSLAPPKLDLGPEELLDKDLKELHDGDLGDFNGDFGDLLLKSSVSLKVCVCVRESS